MGLAQLEWTLLANVPGVAISEGRMGGRDECLLYDCGEIESSRCHSVDVGRDSRGRLGHAGLQTSFDFGVLVEFT